ncbi:hypothetical protein ACFLTH_00735 [Bacteroidota bacterium]
MQNIKNKFQEIRNSNWKKLFFELIVVFLGVSSGFFLNNWRMEEQEKQVEDKYLAAFLNDVNENIPELKNIIESDSIWLTRVTPKLELIQNETLSLDSALILTSLIASISRLDVHNGTYEDITNSGNLNLISDFKLKSLIVDYNIVINGVGFIDDYFYKYFNDFVMPFIFKEFSVLKGEFNNPTVIKSVRFANVVAGYYSMVQQRSAAYSDLLDKTYTLRDELMNYNFSDN